MTRRVTLRKEHADLLDELYQRTQRTVDDLPYTDEFERLFESFLQRSGLSMNRHDVWRAIANRRKSSHLVRKQR